MLHSRYIPNVLDLIRERRGFFLGALLAGLALRLIFLVYFPAITDDSRIYANLATNWLQHGIYGQTQGTAVLPTDTRLPGYPAFLALIFWLFGAGNFKAAMLAQIVIDLATCVIIADIARRVSSGRAAKMAFVLAALCPFLANYSVAELTETLEIFFTALALDCAIAALNRIHDAGAKDNCAEEGGAEGLATTGHKLWAATGAAIAGSILLRPDGGILLASVLLALGVTIWKRRAGSRNLSDLLVSGVIVTAFALAPLVPWTIRNFHTLHHFQPLAPRYANDSDELVPRGFNRWVKTWMIDYTSVEEIYWNVPGEKIDPAKLPSRAIETPDEKDATLALIADYNEDQDVTPELDARFSKLATDRIRAHPIRYYVELPMLRVADMWLRPRTALLPPDPRWWELNDDAEHSIVAVGFGVLNLAYVMAALLALILAVIPGPSRRPPAIRRSGLSSSGLNCSGLVWPGLLLFFLFLLLRSSFLLTIENPEPRYTLECYPAVIVCAAAYLAHVTECQRQSASHC